MAKAKQKVSIEAGTNDFRRFINPPYTARELGSIFIVLFLLVAIPFLVVGTINRQNLISKAKSSSCLERAAGIIDEVKPSVSIESPSEGAYLNGNKTNLLIKLKASDNICLKKLSLLIDGTTVENFTAPPFMYSWDLRSAKAGTHVISARAIDASDNFSVTSVSVFRSVKAFIAP